MDDIVSSGNHYVIQVKRNQPKLWSSLQQMLGEDLPLDDFMFNERAKGQPLTWLTEVYDISQTTLAKEWTGARRLICVGKTIGNGGPALRLFLSDMHTVNAEYYYQGIRGHWGIENQLHWPKDVYHKEDDNGIKHPEGSVNCSTLSTIALNVHRLNERKKIKEAQMIANAKFKQTIDEIRT